MDYCPYCGRDLKSAQREAVERLIRRVDHNQPLSDLLRTVASVTCKKATPYETYMLLKEISATPVRVIERGLDIFTKQAHTRGRAYSSEYFRLLIDSLMNEYEQGQIHIPEIGKENTDNE